MPEGLKKYKYEQCMKRKCQECKHYDDCFRYRGVANDKPKNNRKNK